MLCKARYLEALQTIALDPYPASPFLPMMQQCPLAIVVRKGERPHAVFSRGESVIQLSPNQGLQHLSRTRYILDSLSRDMFERRVALVWCQGAGERRCMARIRVGDGSFRCF